MAEASRRTLEISNPPFPGYWYFPGKYSIAHLAHRMGEKIPKQHPKVLQLLYVHICRKGTDIKLTIIKVKRNPF